ncbi:type II toxin-antitoxin system death-on-curing family toxin [Mucilaginibacter endophyticus]|uniref:type II toxin-antitoxin system death-on-curing family toxin n=1 Tax=Mucilaginibacter endophyticus TaxID=2675003 RepID=UPI000E0D5BB2|nr:type II toxin-antitoxin system death-on-curing family toxin [Mucilaginibacter endophyticus]
MISVEKADQIHNVLIEKFGGLTGIRDLPGLEAALARPYATFDQHELYPDPADKAAAIFESLIINHPFMDGNKRISYVLMRLILMENGFDIAATQDEKYQMVIAASTGQIRFDEIRSWIVAKLIAVK